MSDQSANETGVSLNDDVTLGRRDFLQATGKWSGAAIIAAVAGAWFATAPQAGAWVNRRVGGGGGWVNGGGGGGGGWINGRGAGGWVNRR
ncbi:MAG TPA: hypothetical protein VGH65_01550 [Verrucomicrobiaceae bacterium]|jgi:hypothetical protein